MATQIPLNAEAREGPVGVAVQPGAGFSTAQSFLLLAAVGVPAGIVFLFCYAIDEPLIGGLLAGLPIVLLAFWRAELGLCVFAFVLPFENLALVAEGTTASKILGILVAVAALLHVLRRGRVEMRSWVFWLAFAFVTWSLLTIFKAVDPEWALRTTWLTLFQMVVLVFVVVNLCNEPKNARLFYWMMFLAVGFSAIAGFVYTPVQVGAMARQTFGGENVNSYAKALLPALFLAPFLMVGQKRLLKFFVAFLVLCVFAALVLTGSRSAWGAAFLGVIVMILAYRRMSLSRRVLLSIVAVVVLAGLVAFGVATGLFATGLWDRIVEVQEKGLMTGGRRIFWSRAIALGMENPILGVGIGNAPVRAGIGMTGGWASTHNDLLAFFAETGIPGTLLYVGLLLAALHSAWRTGPAWLRAGLLGLLVAAFVASLANPSAHLKGYWLQFGAIAVGSLAFPGAAEQAKQAALSREDTAPLMVTGSPST